MFTIYVIENIINNKKYIGQTNNLNGRWNSHKNSSKNNSQLVLHKAIRKYGDNNFIITPIYCSKDRQHILALEKHFIREYDTYKNRNGYNMTFGGDGVYVIKEHHNWFGKKHSEESRKKMSISRQPYIEKLRNITAKSYEITFPDGHKEKIINMRQFCRKYNLDGSSMAKVARGIEYRTQHKGFKCNLLIKNVGDQLEQNLKQEQPRRENVHHT